MVTIVSPNICVGSTSVCTVLMNMIGENGQRLSFYGFDVINAKQKSLDFESASLWTVRNVRMDVLFLTFTLLSGLELML